MTQDNQTKFAEILAAQQAKAAAKIQLKTTSQPKPAPAFLPPTVKPVIVKPTPQPVPDVQQPKPAAQAPASPAPELSDVTTDDLLNIVSPQYCAPEAFTLPAMKQAAAAAPIKIVDYSDRAFAVVGETKPIKDQLRMLGGSFNARLTCGAGWIFSKKHLANVREKLSI